MSFDFDALDIMLSRVRPLAVELLVVNGVGLLWACTNYSRVVWRGGAILKP